MHLTMVTVSDAIDALKPEHASALLKAHACYPPKVEGSPSTGQPLEEYLIMVRDDPVAWLHNLPENWKKKKVFDTAKAAMTAMIKCEKLVAAHPALLKDVVRAFREKLTPDVVQAEIDARAPATDDFSETDSVHESESGLEGPGSCSTAGPPDAAAAAGSSATRRLKTACLRVCEVTGQTKVLALLSGLWDAPDDVGDAAVLTQVLRLVCAEEPCTAAEVLTKLFPNV